ncbi:MAG TPA: hypothetical protein VII94_02090 [Candidatus Saccharimonadales bacterium]
MKINNLKTYLVSFVALAILLLFSSKSFAATSTVSPLICGSTNQDISTLEDITTGNMTTGKAYLKLNYTSSPINLSLYISHYSSGQCNSIGNATINSNSWTYVGNILNPSNDVIVQGIGIGAVPYQAATQLLIVPKTQCIPIDVCGVTYDGLDGVLQLDDSNIISGATAQIAIYNLRPINGVGVKLVSYYADNQKSLLYSTKTLKPFDKNYLDGGMHNTQIQIKLSNNQSIFVNQTINMGTDWTGTLFLKSLIYKNSGSAAVFIVSGICILIFLILLWLLRFIYRRRQADKLHGLDSYKTSDISDIDSSDDIFISK